MFLGLLEVWRGLLGACFGCKMVANGEIEEVWVERQRG